MTLEERYGSPVSTVLSGFEKTVYFLEDGRTIVENNTTGDHKVVDPYTRSAD